MVTRQYTDKDILIALAEGLTRKEIAKRYGHADIRTIDNYMRSQGYIWKKELGTYRSLRTTAAGFSAPVETKEKVLDIIDCFSNGMDGKEIAKQFGFKNNRELATYMKQQGFEWNSEQRNYVPKAVKPKTEQLEMNQVISTKDSLNAIEVEFVRELIQYRDILIPMLNVKATIEPSLPVYHIQGITHSKSVQISTSLDELLRSFCREKNISQKQAFEIAIIEFLQKYGYEKELATILQYNNDHFSVAR
ncbi:MAG: hypothetical protein GX072_08595 [Lysinibacillus sp.]|nr:hypothetical protein [Lysinibacillus sp.]